MGINRNQENRDHRKCCSQPQRLFEVELEPFYFFGYQGFRWTNRAGDFGIRLWNLNITVRPRMMNIQGDLNYG